MVPPPAPTPSSPTGPAPASSETPLHFPSGDRPLYAVFHAAGRERRDAPCVIYVHSTGVEHLTNYRNQVLFARRAAELGFPVFRYHARGHGDSTGDFADVTLQSLAEDALAAAAMGCMLSGAARVVWVGARIGALAAARALRDGPPAAALALWEPVHRPVEYFRGMLRGMLFSQVARGERPAEDVDQLLARLEREGRLDVHGYYLHLPLVQSLREADLGLALQGWHGPTLIAQIQGRARLVQSNQRLAADLESRGVAVRTLVVNQEIGWHFIANPAWESQALIAGTAEWLDALA